MKKLLIILPVFTVLFAGAQTSVYHPFPDSNAIWNIEFVMQCSFSTDIKKYSILLDGDTLINGQLYHKLTTPFVQTYSSVSCFDIPAGYKGSVRQDTAAKKVFIVPPSTVDEMLLYDFNMQDW